jgi:hypothetical protein
MRDVLALRPSIAFNTKSLLTRFLVPCHRVYSADHPELCISAQSNHPHAITADEPFRADGAKSPISLRFVCLFAASDAGVVANSILDE